MNILLDSDVLIYSLHIPKDKNLLPEHLKARELFDSVIAGVNPLYLISTIPIEVATGLTKIVGRKIARNGIEKLLLGATEIYPASMDLASNVAHTLSLRAYFQTCIENALIFGKIPKDEKDSSLPGFKNQYTEVRIGGVDISILSYVQLKDLVFITDDWSLWYISWKVGVSSYWLKGLAKEQVHSLANGRGIKFP